MHQNALTKVQRFVAQHGIAEAAKRLGVSRTSVCSFLAGRAQNGTIALVEQNLAQLDEAA